MNPNPTKGDVHGWDCHDDDATLEYNLHDPESTYHKGHHTFVVGEVIACAPACPVMIVRVGYGNPASWWRGVEYAVEHGAKILVIPHGFITHGRGSPDPLFYRGTDFSYPMDNLRTAILQRRVYGTTGARIVLCFETSDCPMGSIVPKTVPRVFQVRVEGTAPLADVELIRDGVVVDRMEPSHVLWEGVLRDPAPDDHRTHWYLLRITQQGGHRAWSSPIWL